MGFSLKMPKITIGKNTQKTMGVIGGGVIGGILGGVPGAALGMGAGGMLTGGGGGASGGPDMTAAYQAQANAAVKVADKQAAAARYTADAALKGAKTQADAAIKSSQNAALGGVLGAALGAHTTHEEIKQWLPHEAGAATIQSWSLAQQWQKTLEMRTAGYSDTAINYELSGKNYKSLFGDAQWNSLQMAQQTQKDLMASAKMFGIKSASNPTGINITPEDWVEIHSFKDPKSLMSVDPSVAAARNAEFEKWQQDMYAQGKGLIVDLYKNPQLAGSSILSMKGKDPLLDPALAPLIGNLMGGADAGKPTWQQQTAINGATNWSQIANALTKGENNEMSEQVKWAMEQGIVDKYGMVNAGALAQHIPPSLMEPPEYSIFRELSEQEQIRLQDDYNNLASMKIDPKLIREENLGMGVTRRVRLNEDGSIAATAMEGYMTNMMGEQIFVSMNGNRLQEWYDRQSTISGMGPLFPGMMAPVTDSELSGRFEPGFWGKNVNAKPNAGNPTQPTQPKATAKPAATSNPYSSPKPTTNTAKSGTPSGYTGAPLAAGEG